MKSTPASASTRGSGRRRREEFGIEDLRDLVSRAFEMRFGVVIGGLGQRRGDRIRSARAARRGKTAFRRRFRRSTATASSTAASAPAGRCRFGRAVQLRVHELQKRVLQVAPIGVDLDLGERPVPSRHLCGRSPAVRRRCRPARRRRSAVRSDARSAGRSAEYSARLAARCGCASKRRSVRCGAEFPGRSSRRGW